MTELSKILTVCRYTFKEILKSKVLYNTAFLGVGLLLAVWIAQQFTYGEPERVALDFGTGVLSLSSVAIAIFMGAGLVSKEIENRTVYMVISRPVKRSSFVLGRIFGLNLVLVLNILVLSFLTLAVYFLSGGVFQPLILWTILFIVLEASLMLLVVSLFSLLTSNTLSVILSIAVFVSGNAVGEAQNADFTMHRPLLRGALEAYQFILPAFGKLNTRDLLIYNQNVDALFLIKALGYACAYGAFLIMLSLFIFERKNLD